MKLSLLALSALLLSTAAFADVRLVKLNMSVKTRDGNLNSLVIVGAGDTAQLKLKQANGKMATLFVKPSIISNLKNGDEMSQVEFEMKDSGGELIASPRIVSKFGDTASFSSVIHSSNDTLELTVTPTLQ